METSHGSVERLALRREQGRAELVSESEGRGRREEPESATLKNPSTSSGQAGGVRSPGEKAATSTRMALEA